MTTMRLKSTLTKMSAAALAVFLLNSCKKDAEELNNISAFRKDASQAEYIDVNSVNSKMILEDRVNGVDYLITKNMEVNAELVIKPGVTLMFEDGAGIVVNEQGSITAIGEDGNEVMFTSKSGKRGAWYGIVVLSNSAKNVLSYCKIEHGGRDNVSREANVVIGSGANTAQLEISHSEITAGKADGITMAKGSKLNYFTYNKVNTNTAYSVSMYQADAFAMEVNNEFMNNGQPGIHYIQENSTIKGLANINGEKQRR